MFDQLQGPRTRTGRIACLLGAAAFTLSSVATPLAAQAATSAFPSDTAKPDLVSILSGYDQLWQSSGSNDLHGIVMDASPLERNDELTVWINHHATPAQQFRAMQNSEYDTGGTYDQSVTIADGLGSALGPIYVQGRNSGALPLTSALINSETGTAGAYVDTGAAKGHYSYPRPFLAADPDDSPVAGDDPACSPALVNSASVKALRTGQPYADAYGNLAIRRVANVTDTTHEFSSSDVPLSAGYGTSGICRGGSFPSGHTTTAYQAGVTLATLLPELAPEILARTSEAGNNRIVLGVHYPLDIMGGRISGEAAVAARWSDARFRTEVLEPARAELVGYLERECGGPLKKCIADQTPYRNDPYGGQSLPGGSAQIVKNRSSAAAVYRERLTYGFPTVSATGRPPSVPDGAQNLLLTTFPTLTDAQRVSVLAQTEIGSGYPLDGTGTAAGSWERLDLAAALSATVRVNASGSVTVLNTGGDARVVSAKTGALHATTRKVPAGGTLHLTGSGFAAGRATTLVLHGSREVRLGATTPSGSGVLAADVVIPPTTTIGGHTIDAIDDTGASVLVRPLEIEVTTPADDPTTRSAAAGRSTGMLAATGAQTASLSGLAILLVACSGGLLAAHRRRLRGKAGGSRAS